MRRKLTTNVTLRLNVLVVIRLDKAEPLLDAALDVSSALSHITKQSSGQAKVRFGIGKDLEIKHIQHTLIMQGEDAFQDEHMWRIDSSRLI
jgi:hypothetical protein